MQLTSLDVSNNIALSHLDCSDNRLTSLDVLNNIALSHLDCSGNGWTTLWGEYEFTSLDVSNNIALLHLDCSDNQLTSLDVSGCTALKELHCYDNQLTSLDVSGCTALRVLNCYGNLYDPPYDNTPTLTSLDVSGCTALEVLGCFDMQLTSLDVSGCTVLKDLRCIDMQLTSLDVSNNRALANLNCSENQLTSLDISNNTALEFLSITTMPTLYEVCVWAMPFPSTNIEIESVGSPKVCYTTDCGSCLTGIEGYSQSGLSIYPNPTNDVFKIETGIVGQHSIEITSLNGQIIQSRTFIGSSHQIDLSSFQKGVYFITVRSKDFNTTEKIIKL
jgi:hypothetical protein